jgi:3-phosphoshikimate 1-carboxyvinyltransferase
MENARRPGGEPDADVTVSRKKLKGVEIGGDSIPSLIDELPVIAVLACFARGRTVVRDAAELRVKETDRIQAMADNLTAMGADITATADGWIIEGRGALRGGAAVDSYGDHRIAMSMAVAGLCSREGVTVKNAGCVDISFPGFWELLAGL